jgi:hypothetical protein
MRNLWTLTSEYSVRGFESHLMNGCFVLLFSVLCFPVQSEALRWAKSPRKEFQQKSK